jgi:hypothetical protein
MVSDIGTLSPEQMLQQQQNLRNLKMSEMLVQQGMQQPQGQMVGGRYVPPSIFQNIAGLANTYMGQRGIEKAEQANLNLAKQLRQQGVQDTERLMNVFGGRPEVAGTPDVPTETYETVRGTPAQPAIPPNPRLAFAEAINMQSPQARALLPQIAAEAFKKPEAFILPEGASRFVTMPDGSTKEVAKGAPKQPEKIQTAAIVLGLDRKPRNEWTPQDLAMIDRQIQKTAQSGAVNLGQKGLDNTLKLRGDFRSEPVYKDFQAIDSAYRIINKSLDAGTAAGDLGASTKLMKLLDPDSVVRESELAMAMQATGKLDQLYNYANKIATGQFLSPKQKSEFRSLATEFYNSAGEQYNLKRSEYADIADRNQINVLDVVGSEVKLKPQIVKTPEGKNKPASAEKIPPAPQGFDPKLWNVMTPQERELFK